MPEITKIVITGGPCAGKSTAMSWIQNAFIKMGYVVLFVPETATELITGGVAPWTCGTNLEYQKCQLHLQIEKEKIFHTAAETMVANKILLVCDRGALDNKAYMTSDEFSEVLSELNTNEIELRDQYDAVFHLVSAADGAEAFYTTANNEARTETIEQAIALDHALIAAWTGHPHLRVIDNSLDFEAKIVRLIREISHFLGEPKPFEIERKFLIEYPDITMLETLPNCQKVDIIQTYLLSPDPDAELRIRQRGCDGNYIYIQTEKRKISEVKRVEVENRLSKSEYLALLMNADTSLRQIRKTRYCLMHEKQYFEIDIYPFWNKQAIVEIELTEETLEIFFPDFIQVVREVTEDEQYKNHSLAKTIPPEKAFTLDFHKALSGKQSLLSRNLNYFITRYSETGVYGYELLRDQTSICINSNIVSPCTQSTITRLKDDNVLITHFNPKFKDITIVPGLRLEYEVCDALERKIAVFEKVFGDFFSVDYIAFKTIDGKSLFFFNRSATHEYVAISPSNELIAFVEPDKSFIYDPCSSVENRSFLRINNRFIELLPEIFHSYISEKLGVLK